MKNTLVLPLAIVLSTCLAGAQTRLDPTSFVVLGGGWAAGYADFQLTGEKQEQSFPKLMAGPMDTIMPLPIVRAVSNGGLLSSFNPLPTHLPAVNQSGVRRIPFPLFAFNLSVPFLKVSESLNRRASAVPGDKLYMLDEEDIKRSLINLVLGYPLLVLDDPVAWTQVEYAEEMAPTFVLIQLGLGDALPAALSADPSQLTPASEFSASYREVVSRMLRTHATILLMDVPDPLDSAFFSSVDTVASRYGVAAETLLTRFGLSASDLVTLSGLLEIADALAGRGPDELSPESVLDAGVAAAIRVRVGEYNSAITDVASSNRLQLFRLSDLARDLKETGVMLGPWRLTGDYLGGFYSQDGIFPGKAGQVLLANRLLDFLNGAYGTNYPLLDVGTALKAEDLPQAGTDGGVVEPREPAPERKGWLRRRGRS